MIDFSAEWSKVQYFRKLRTEYRELNNKSYLRASQRKERKEFIENKFKQNNFKL